MRRVLQCVLLDGIDSSVLVTTSSICRSVILRGAPRAAHQQTIQPRFSKSFPPFADSRAGNLHFPGDLRVAHPLFTTEHDPSAHRHGLRRLRPTGDHAQFLAILVRNLQRFFGSACAHTQVCSQIRTFSTYFSLRTLAVPSGESNMKELKPNKDDPENGRAE
jgi:hypothetical protein